MSRYYLYYICDQGSSNYHREGLLIDSAKSSNIESVTTCHILRRTCPRWMVTISCYAIVGAQANQPHAIRCLDCWSPNHASVMDVQGSSVPSQPASLPAYAQPSFQSEERQPSRPSDLSDQWIDGQMGWLETLPAAPAVMTCRGQPSRPDPVDDPFSHRKGRAFRGIITKLHL